MTAPSPSSSSSSSPSELLSCLPLPSISSLFLSCIRTRKDKVRSRRSPNPPCSSSAAPTNNAEADGCTHPTTGCTCTYKLPPAHPDLEKKFYPALPASHNPNAISIVQTTATTTTSIRIVDSDSSSEYGSHSITSVDTDAISLSDYGCGCGFGGDEHNCEDDIEDPNTDTGTDQISLATRPRPRPLPPLPVQTQSQSPSISRKSPEVKTKTRLSCIEETIPEEEEDAYLARQRQEEDSKHHRPTTSRRKSMIELFNLSTSSSSGTASTSAGPGLSLTFSNLSFRFPMPPIWDSGTGSPQRQSEKEDSPAGGNTRHESVERKRPISMSALYLSCSAPSATVLTSISASPSQPPSTERSSKKFLNGDQKTEVQDPSPTTTKKQRRMGTILFPPLAFLSRSSVGSTLDRESTGSALTNCKTLFC